MKGRNSGRWLIYYKDSESKESMFYTYYYQGGNIPRTLDLLCHRDFANRDRSCIHRELCMKDNNIER